MKFVLKTDFTEKAKFEDFNGPDINLRDFKHIFVETKKFLLKTKKLQKKNHNNVFNIHMY